MTFKPLSSLRARVAALVLMAVAPVFALLLVSHFIHRRQGIDRAGANALQLARLASEHHDRLVEGARQLLAGLSRLPEVRERNITACEPLFADLLHDNPGYGSIGLVDLDGNIISPRAAADQRLNVIGQPWFPPVKAGRGFTVGGYQWGRITRRMVLICGQPLFDGRGQVCGVVFVSLRTEWVERFAAAAGLPPGSTLTVLSRDGKVWARHPDGANWVGKAVPEAPVVRDVIGAGLKEAPDLGGEARVCAVAALSVSDVGPPDDPGSRVYVVASLPRQAVVAPANRELATNLAVLAAVTVLTLIGAEAGSRLWVCRWVQRLAAAADRLAAGELSARAGLAGGPSEFRRVGHCFDEMASALERATARRAAAEAELQDGHRLLRAVVEFVGDALFIKDLDGRYLLVNSAGALMAGRSVDEMVGRDDSQIFPPATAAAFRESDRRVIDTGTAETLEQPFTTGGLAYHFLTTKAPYRDGGGAVIGLLGVSRDMTPWKRAEQALRESEERLSLALQAAELGTWDTDLRTDRAVWSEQVFRLMGYDPAVASGLAGTDLWRSRLHPDDVERVVAARQAAMRDGSLYNPEYRVIRADDGRVVWVSVAGRFLYDAGKPVRFIGVIQDVTARKRAEVEIARLNQDLQHRVGELQTLLEVLPVGIGIARDPACARIDVNPYFARLLGVSPGDNASLTAPPGERPTHFTCWVDGRPLVEQDLPLQRAARDGAVTRDLEVQVRLEDGRVFDLLEFAVPLLDASGRPRGAVGAFVDVTERRRAEGRERKQQEELAHLSRLVTMGEMASGLAHELNQPLGAILNYAVACTSLLESPPPAGGNGNRVDANGANAKALDLLREVERETKRAGDIIARLRAFVRKKAPNRAPVDVADLVHNAVKLMEAEVRLHSVRLRLEVAGPLPKVMADPIQIEQVLVNLVRNAVEAMASAEPARRRLVVGAAEDGAGAVRVSVLDAGAGIPAGSEERIFDSFFTTKPEGLGVGLTISRSIVESHGGRLGYAPNPGGGTVFYFTLPSCLPGDRGSNDDS